MCVINHFLQCSYKPWETCIAPWWLKKTSSTWCLAKTSSLPAAVLGDYCWSRHEQQRHREMQGVGHSQVPPHVKEGKWHIGESEPSRQTWTPNFSLCPKQLPKRSGVDWLQLMSYWPIPTEKSFVLAPNVLPFKDQRGFCGVGRDLFHFLLANESGNSLLGHQRQILEAIWRVIMNGHQAFPESLTHLPQVVKISFSKKEAQRLNFHSSDPSTLPLMEVHCQKTTPCSALFVYASPWTLTLILLELHHHSSKFSHQSTFLGTYSSDWQQKPCKKDNESCQSAKKVWGPQSFS